MTPRCYLKQQLQDTGPNASLTVNNRDSLHGYSNIYKLFQHSGLLSNVLSTVSLWTIKLKLNNSWLFFLTCSLIFHLPQSSINSSIYWTHDFINLQKREQWINWEILSSVFYFSFSCIDLWHYYSHYENNNQNCKNA